MGAKPNSISSRDVQRGDGIGRDQYIKQLGSGSSGTNLPP